MSEKGKSIIAYLFGWIGGLIVLYGMNNNEKNTKFHAAQSIVLSGGYCAITIILSIVPIRIGVMRTVIGLVYIAGIVLGIIKANNEENPELPIIGEIAKSLFSKKIEE